jgi:putative transposase
MSETQNLKLPDEINEALDKLIKTYSKPEDIMGEDGLLKRLTKAVIERALEGEMTHHLGYERGEIGKRQNGNARHGKKPKTVKSSSGELSIAVPRDRNGTFQPILVPKRQRRIGNFDDLIISLYTRGMTTRRDDDGDSRTHPADLRGGDVD